MKTIRHTVAADSDLQSIFGWTLDVFGELAVKRYSELIGRALQDLSEDSERAGTRHATEDFFIYHLRHSLTPDRRPQVHLHDAMDLEQHFPEESS